MSGFLFDLDQTLLDTSAVEAWRSLRMWQAVDANLDKVKPFVWDGFAAHDLPRFLRALGHRVGVITASPRWYAEKLLRRFGVEYDGLIAYEDTVNHKPDPDPITAALAQLGIEARDACHVGDAPGDQEASYHAGVASIGALWGVQNPEAFSSAAPDILVTRPHTLLELDTLDRRGYVGELLAAGREPKMHRGSMLPCGGDPPRYVLGRYFKTEDPRHAGSALCAQVLALKNDDGPAKIFGRALGEFLAELDWKPHDIVPIPPKPSQARNRFEALLGYVEPWLSDGTEVVLDGLKCVREIEGYKQMTAPQRAAAMPGTYESTYTWDERRVLLVDDVLTTGETVRECARVILADGAREVRIVALGKDQRAFAREMCPRCQRSLRVRTNGRTGEKFWGCSGFRRDDPDSCNFTRSM